MDFGFGLEQEMLRKSAREFLTKECPKEFVREMVTDEKGYSPQLWEKMVHLGWMGLAFPEKYGGTGEDFMDLVILSEEMGRVCLPSAFFSTVILGGLTIMELGNETQKRKFLPQVASGEMFLTLAMIEVRASYKAEDITTRATRGEGGYIINGNKFYVPDAHLGDYIICVAKTDKGKFEKGISLFLVDSKSAGITCILQKTISNDKQFEVQFNQVAVPESNILGKIGHGWDPFETVLRKITVAKCAEMIGGAQYVLEISVKYAKEREQFGRPIGSFQAIQHHCANMLIDVETAKYLIYEAAWELSQEIPSTIKTSMAKAWVSDVYRRVVHLGHQIHGALGFCEDSEMPIFFKRAIEAEFAFGDADYHREAISQHLGL